MQRIVRIITTWLCISAGALIAQEEPFATKQQVRELQKNLNEQQRVGTQMAEQIRDVARSSARQSRDFTKSLADTNETIEIESARNQKLTLEIAERNRIFVVRMTMLLFALLIAFFALGFWMFYAFLKSTTALEKRITTFREENGLTPEELLSGTVVPATPPYPNIRDNAQQHELAEYYEKFHAATGQSEFDAKYIVHPENMAAIARVTTRLGANDDVIFSLQFPGTTAVGPEKSKIYRAARISLGLPQRHGSSRKLLT
jgi:hypothetical protein